MELIKGETLKQVITHKHPSPAQSIKIILQIAEAMQQAHDLGLTHGDLKPSNIMLEPSGNIRILDFGLACKADPEATTSMLRQDPQGTIAYMAPERVLGGPLTPAIDVYALGIIFYELLTGKRPFADLNGLALAAALVQSSSDQWNYPADLSPALIYLIRRMTAKKTEQRLSTMAEVLALLDAHKNGVTSEFVPAKPEIEDQPRVIDESLKTSRKNTLKKAALISFVAISCIVFGGWFTRNVLWHFEEVIPRYSESQEMKLGMDALGRWDRSGSLDSAIKHFSNVAEQSPKNAAAIAGLSIAYSFSYQSDDYDEIWLQKADASAQQALAINNQLALSWIAVGMVQIFQGKYELGLRSQEHAFALDPSNKFVWYAKFYALKGLNLLVDASSWIQLGLERFPHDRILWDLLGEIYYKQSNYPAAENAFRQSIALEPDAVISYANLNAILLHQNRIDEALQLLQQGLQVRPSFNLYTNLGNVLFLQQNYLAAARAFELAVSSKGNPKSYIGWANLADTLRWIPGRANEARNAYMRAKEMLEERLLRSSGNVILISRMGLYSARIGDYSSAIKFSEEAIQLSPDNPSVHFRAGLVFELIGNRRKAIEEIKKAKSLGYPQNIIEAEPDLVSLLREVNY
jgi:serine/threonine-protein kinase